jgi:hypothetical protein
MEVSMKYEIHGADSKTGADRKIIVDAEDGKEALSKARMQGILTSNIYKIHDVPFHESEDGPKHANSVICPNPKCDYQGKPKKIARGNMLVAIFMVLFSILPGLFFYIDMFNDYLQLSVMKSGSGTPGEVLGYATAIPVHAISALAISFPGVLYLVFRIGYIHVCPKCGLQMRGDS